MWRDPIQTTDGDTVAEGGTVADSDTVAQRGIVAGKSSSETASRGLRRVQPHHTCRVRNHRCPDPANHHRFTSKRSRQSSEEQKSWATGEKGGHSGRPASWGLTTYQHRAPTSQCTNTVHLPQRAKASAGERGIPSVRASKSGAPSSHEAWRQRQRQARRCERVCGSPLCPATTIQGQNCSWARSMRCESTRIGVHITPFRSFHWRTCHDPYTISSI